MPMPAVARKSLKWLVILTILAAAALAVWRPDLYASALAVFTGDKSGQDEPPALYAVARGTLTIGIVEEGRLLAVKNHQIKQSVGRSRAKIAWVISEGAQVSKGDKHI